MQKTLFTCFILQIGFVMLPQIAQDPKTNSLMFFLATRWYKKYSDPFKFSTLCFIAAISENQKSSFYLSLMHTSFFTEKNKNVDFFANLLKKEKQKYHMIINIQSFYSGLSRSFFLSSFSHEFSWEWWNKLLTPWFGDCRCSCRSSPGPSGWMVNVGGQWCSGLSREGQLGLGLWLVQSCSKATLVF